MKGDPSTHRVSQVHIHMCLRSVVGLRETFEPTAQGEVPVQICYLPKRRSGVSLLTPFRLTMRVTRRKKKD